MVFDWLKFVRELEEKYIDEESIDYCSFEASGFNSMSHRVNKVTLDGSFNIKEIKSVVAVLQNVQVKMNELKDKGEFR
jgi:hypothetical protein